MKVSKAQKYYIIKEIAFFKIYRAKNTTLSIFWKSIPMSKTRKSKTSSQLTNMLAWLTQKQLHLSYFQKLAKACNMFYLTFLKFLFWNPLSPLCHNKYFCNLWAINVKKNLILLFKKLLFRTSNPMMVWNCLPCFKLRKETIYSYFFSREHLFVSSQIFILLL